MGVMSEGRTVKERFDHAKRGLHELAARVQHIDKSRKHSRRDAFENDGDEEPGTNEDASEQDEMLGGTSAPLTSEPDITFDTEDNQ